MDFVFRITSIDNCDIQRQVSSSLEKIAELNSRNQYPKLWAITDRLNAEKYLSRRSRLLPALCLVFGIFLFVPGVLEPQALSIPLLAGGIGIVVGLFGLFGPIKRSTKKFDKAAQSLIHDISSQMGDKSVVQFSDSGIQLCDKSIIFPYEQLEYAIEAQDIFLIVHQGIVLVVQKKDLVNAQNDSFSEYISRKAHRYIHI